MLRVGKKRLSRATHWERKPSRLLSLTHFGNLHHQKLLLNAEDIYRIEKKNHPTHPKLIAFVVPLIPHPCELEIWFNSLVNLNAQAVVLTSTSEKRIAEQFYSTYPNAHEYLEFKYFDSIQENKTFLAGVEQELENVDLIIAVGESSLATYQSLKVRKNKKNRLVVWQSSPRPPEFGFLTKFDSLNNLEKDFRREKTIRKEVLAHCDALITFDKDGASWAYLADVAAQRIRRIPRGINIQRYTSELNASRRIALRQALGLPEADFIFLQAGPLEIESGALDSAYAFKTLLQSEPSLLGKTKLVYCGTGQVGSLVRQTIMDLDLDEHVLFINPNDSETMTLLGNQLSNLLPLCDALIHNPTVPVNVSPIKYLDCTYDVLCAVASGLTIVSNGQGWVGEWLGRFYKTFGAGSIHSQSRLMKEGIEKQDKILNLKRAARTTLENELNLEKSVAEVIRVIRSLTEQESQIEKLGFAKAMSQIENAMKAKQFIDAINFISQAFNIPNLSDVNRAQLFRSVGDCFTKLGDLNSGRQNYQLALELDPYCARTLIGLGTVALQEQQYNIAVPHFQKAIALAPQDDMASLGLGLAFEGLGEWDEAYKWTLRAAQIDVKNTAAIFLLVKLSYDLNRFEEPAEILTAYLSKEPNDINMLYTLGGIHFKLGRYNQAEEDMVRILALDPNNQRAQALLTQIQASQTLKQA